MAKWKFQASSKLGVKLCSLYRLWLNDSSRLMQLRGQRGKGCHWGGKSPNNVLICLLVLVTLYSTLRFEKNFFWTTVYQEATKKCLLTKTTHTVVHMYSSECSNNADLSWWVKLKWGPNGRASLKLGARPPHLSLEPPLPEGITTTTTTITTTRWTTYWTLISVALLYCCCCWYWPGGADGSRGMNLLIHTDGRCVNLGGKASVDVHAGVCSHDSNFTAEPRVCILHTYWSVGVPCSPLFQTVENSRTPK